MRPTNSFKRVRINRTTSIYVTFDTTVYVKKRKSPLKDIVMVSTPELFKIGDNIKVKMRTNELHITGLKDCELLTIFSNGCIEMKIRI